ncbi:MAG: hypothetical protein ACI94Y_004375 [Maribacter sp.]|jgi:hypothetical protein
MKKIAILSFLCCSVLFYFGCEEVGPNINVGGGGVDPGTDVQARNILVEEFTGVRCVNCPEGSEVIESLKEVYGARLIPISIHAGFFSNPYPESLYDFRTTEGDQIEQFLGPVSAFPAAVINRKIFDGASGLVVGKNSWAGYIAQDVETTTPVEINISKSFDVGTRLLDITVDLSFVETVSDPLMISVVITEDNVEDYQLAPAGKLPNYVHKHVFRGMMTNPGGNSFSNDTNAGDSGSEVFTKTLPEAWDVNKCEIVAFVHSATTKEVLQAYTIHITD